MVCDNRCVCRVIKTCVPVIVGVFYEWCYTVLDAMVVYDIGVYTVGFRDIKPTEMTQPACF